CVAVGGPFGTNGYAWTETGGNWTVQVVTPPADDVSSFSSNDWVEMNGVSCPAVGSCAAIATYSNNHFDLAEQSGSSSVGLIVNQSGSAWTSVNAATPSDPFT